MSAAALWEWLVGVAPELAKVIGGGLVVILAREALERLRLPKEVRAALAQLRPLSAVAVERAKLTQDPWDNVWTELADALLQRLAQGGVEVTPEVKAKVAADVAAAERKARKAKKKADPPLRTWAP